MAYDNNFGYAQNGYTQYLDNSGKPLTGGTLSTFIAGTTTPIATYKDFNGGQNPAVITLDENGGATVILKQDIVYKFIIRDKNGDIFKTIDNVISSGNATIVENTTIVEGDDVTISGKEGEIVVDYFTDTKEYKIKLDDRIIAKLDDETVEHILDLSTLDEENSTFDVVLTANRNNAISFVGSSEQTATVAIEIEDNKLYHIQIVGACTLALTGVEWWSDEITDITNKAEISILNNVAIGVLYE